MLWIYTAMLETAEQKDKITYIYETYVGLMYHVALKVVGEHYLAEDVVHETFLRLIRIIDDVKIDDTTKLKHFLALLTHSKAVDLVRKLNKIKPISNDELINHPTPENSPEDVALNSIVFEDLVSFVRQMDEKYSTPLHLRWMGYSIQEISKFLDISQQNTKVRLYRAKQMILTQLEAQDELTRKP